jgi:hypothetical protein
MSSTIEIRFKGNRAYRFEASLFRWMPIAADKARLMVATGEAQDITNQARIY